MYFARPLAKKKKKKKKKKKFIINEMNKPNGLSISFKTSIPEVRCS